MRNISYLKTHNEDTLHFKLLFEKFYPSLCFFANKIVHNEESACDIVQDAFAYCWQKKANFNDFTSTKSYLFNYVKSKSLNYIRDAHLDRKIELEYIEKQLTYEKFIIEDETYILMNKAIKSLSPREKIVIELTLDGHKNREIAHFMNISVNTVKTFKTRAYKIIRAKLKDVISINLFALSFFSRRFN